MKKSLLDITQEILSDMDSDEVNSIDETVEATQVAEIVRSTYFAMISNRNWPHTRRSVNLVASGDASYPTHMRVEEDFKELCFINYDKASHGETRKKFLPIKWVEPDDFLRVTNSRNNDSQNVDIITDYTGVTLMVFNDRHPTYYTSFDDNNLVFDSYDNEVDTTLQSTKTQAMAYVIPKWEQVDDFIPDLPSEAFTALIEEAKSRCMLRLKQVQDIKAEQEANRQQRWLSRKAWTVHGGIRMANYGRRRRSSSEPTFRSR